MPRMSVEAKAAEVWKHGGKHPKAPMRLSSEARKLWREIVETRPIDYFRPGSLTLLEQLCEVTIAQRAALRDLSGDPTNAALVKTCKDLTNMTVSLSRQLRLSVVSTIDNASGKTNEKETKLDELLGGDRVVRLRVKR